MGTPHIPSLRGPYEGQGGTLVHYPTPIHLQEVYQRLGYKKGAFPEAERAASEILSLPMYPTMRDEEVVAVSGAVKAFYTR
jgi:dTDP-4-amino-4,6-dideoxygalactose transaminase